MTQTQTRLRAVTRLSAISSVLPWKTPGRLLSLGMTSQKLLSVGQNLFLGNMTYQNCLSLCFSENLYEAFSTPPGRQVIFQAFFES